MEGLKFCCHRIYKPNKNRGCRGNYKHFVISIVSLVSIVSLLLISLSCKDGVLVRRRRRYVIMLASPELLSVSLSCFYEVGHPQEGMWGGPEGKYGDV